MLPGQTLVMFLSLFLTAASGLTLYAAAERDFRPPVGSPPDATRLAGRCYALAFERRLHRDIGAEMRLPTFVRLTTRVSPEPYASGWLMADRAVADSARRPPAGWAQPNWRPVAPDSVDIRYFGWPLSLRLRLPIREQAAIGRVLSDGDVGGEWSRLDVVRGRLVDCGEIAFQPSRKRAP